MTLGIGPGSRLRISAHGENAELAIKSFEEYFSYEFADEDY